MLGKDQAGWGSVLDFMCPASLVDKTSIIILQHNLTQIVLPVISLSPEGT